MTIDNFPTTRPSFTANFARSQQLPPQVNFTRTTTGTSTSDTGLVVTAPVDVPRFNWQDGNCQGLLLEEARTNFCTDSGGMSNFLAVRNTTIALDAAEVAPDGTTGTVQLLSYVGAAGTTVDFGLVRKQLTGLANAEFCTSVYAKADGKQWLALLDMGSAQFRAYYDVQNGVMGTVQAGWNAGIIPLGNGWFRCWLSQPDEDFQQFAIGLADADNDPAITPGGGILVWGPQLEQGSFLTSYIPTANNTVNRAQDLCVVTGDDFLSWYRASNDTFASTWVVSGTQLSTTNGVQDAVENPFCDMFTLMTPQRNDSDQWSALQAHQVRINGFNTDTTPAGVPVKLALAYGLNFVSMAVQARVSGAGSINPGMFASGSNELRIGRSNNTLNQWNGTIYQISYYPVVLPNAALEALTQ